MQLRDNDIKVNDEPKLMLEHSTERNHCISVEDLNIALPLKGVVSYFLVSKPPKEEYGSSSFDDRIVLTYYSTAWDPHTARFGIAEKARSDYHGNKLEQKVKKISRVLSTIYAIPS